MSTAELIAAGEPVFYDDFADKYCDVEPQALIDYLQRNEQFSLEVKRSTIPDAGYGLFARRELFEGEVFAVYDGNIYDARKDRRTGYLYIDDALKTGLISSKHYEQYLFETSNGFYIDPTNSLGQYANDSIDIQTSTKSHKNYLYPRNAVFKELTPYEWCTKFDNFPSDIQIIVVLMATRDIVPKEEIFLNYGNEYWDDVVS